MGSWTMPTKIKVETERNLRKFYAQIAKRDRTTAGPEWLKLIQIASSFQELPLPESPYELSRIRSKLDNLLGAMDQWSLIAMGCRSRSIVGRSTLHIQVAELFGDRKTVIQESIRRLVFDRSWLVLCHLTRPEFFTLLHYFLLPLDCLDLMYAMKTEPEIASSKEISKQLNDFSLNREKFKLRDRQLEMDEWRLDSFFYFSKRVLGQLENRVAKAL
jgi:hypothetical protein